MKEDVNIIKSDLINKQRVKTDNFQDNLAIELSGKRPAIDLLVTEGGESFYNYIDWLGLAKDPDLLVLSSMHHYYYDPDDLKDIRTVVNMMPLNQIKHVKGLFHTIYHLIPHKCYFIGCFADHRKNHSFLFMKNPLDEKSESADIGIRSKIPFLNILYKLMELRTDNYLSMKSVTFDLENLGFKVLDMTELQGLTYFCTQKILPSNNNQ